jgi:peptide/nickel transport system permease protein
VLRFIAIRIAGVLPQLLLVSLLAFGIVRAAPGDPVASLAGGVEYMSAADHARVSRNLGLDQPLHVQYGRWLARMLQGDWGHSLKDGRPVFEVVTRALGYSLLLVGIVWVLIIVTGIVLGYLAGSAPDSLRDTAISGFAALSFAVPPFWLGLMLIVLFSVGLNLLPASGSARIGDGSLIDRAAHLVLPVATLLLTQVGPYIRLVRSSVRDTLSSGFMRAARARGLGRRTLVRRHLLPNALTPFITWAGSSLPLLISGAFVVEWVFSWPGLGRLFLQAATSREYPFLMGCVIVVCTLVIAGNLLADCLVAALNPKLRRSHAGD